MLSRLPIFVSVPILLAVPVVVVAVALSVVAYHYGRESARDLTQQSLLQIHGQIEGHLIALLDTPRRINRVNHSLIRQGKLPVDDVPSWRPTLIEQVAAYPMISSVTWGGVDGSATWVCRYAGDERFTYYGIQVGGETFREYRVHPGGRVEDQPTSTFEFDAGQRPWYADPVRAGAATWTAPYVWLGGGESRQVTLGVSYGEPVRIGGDLAGVIDVDLSLNDISHYLAALRIGRTGSVYLMDSAGLIVGSSTEAALADENGERIAAAASAQPRIAVSAAAIAESPRPNEAPPAGETITIDGERLFMVASSFAHDTGMRWVIVTLVPENDFLADVRAGRQRGALLAAVAVAATLLLGVGLSVVMVRPMLQLTRHARAVGGGDLDREIALRQSPELVRLSDELNRMTAGLRDRMRMRESLAMAMEVQQSLLPDDAPVVQGLDVDGHSTYCDETGGDYYDFLDVAGVGDRTLAVALGDVMGHGVAAAMLMATARGILRSRSQQPRSLADLLTHMNDMLVPDTRGQRFMTMLLMLIDTDAHQLRWASAGHDMPIVYDPADDTFPELDGGSLPLGLVRDETYEEYHFDNLRPGQVIIVSTDGLWETRNADGEQFGKPRVRELLRAHHGESAKAISRLIRETLHTWAGTVAQDDDVTFVVVRVLE